MAWGLLGLKTNGGMAVGTDPAPNSTPPTRTFIVPDRSQIFQGAIIVAADADCTVTVWAYEDNLAKWIAILTSLSVAGGTVNSTWGAGLASAKMFVQITDNSSGATFVGAQVF